MTETFWCVDGKMRRMWFASRLPPGVVGGASVGDGRFWKCGGEHAGIFQVQRRKGAVVLETEAGSRGNRFEEM